MFYTTPVLVFPSSTLIAQYKMYYEQNGYVTNIFINLSLGHKSNSERGGRRALPLCHGASGWGRGHKGVVGGRGTGERGEGRRGLGQRPRRVLYFSIFCLFSVFS